jgi:hypothetical protein
MSGPALGPTQFPIQLVNSFLGGKVGQEREADCLPPSSAQVKNVWNHTSTFPYAFMAWSGASLGYESVGAGIA